MYKCKFSKYSNNTKVSPKSKYKLNKLSLIQTPNQRLQHPVCHTQSKGLKTVFECTGHCDSFSAITGPGDCVCVYVCVWMCHIHNAPVTSLCDIQKNNREEMMWCCERNWVSCFCVCPANPFIKDFKGDFPSKKQALSKHKHMLTTCICIQCCLPWAYPSSTPGSPDVTLSETGNGCITMVEVASTFIFVCLFV